MYVSTLVFCMGKSSVSEHYRHKKIVHPQVFWFQDTKIQVDERFLIAQVSEYFLNKCYTRRSLGLILNSSLKHFVK